MGFFDWLSGDEEDPNQYVGMSIPDPNEDYSKYGFQDFIKGLTSTVGGLVEIPKKPVDWLASKMSGLPETRPAEELLTNALFPERLAGDPNEVPTEFGEGGEVLNTRPATPEEQVFGESVNRIGRKATTTVGGLALNPITPALGLPGAAGKAVAGAFIPGMAESLGEQSGKAMSAYESGDIPGMAENIFGAGLDTFFLGKMAKHIAGREAPVSSEVKQTERVTEPVEEPARIQTPEEGYPGLETAAPKPQVDTGFELGEIPAENVSHVERAKELTEAYMESLKPQVVKVLGDEKYYDTKIAYEPNLRTMMYDRPNNTIYIDPELLITQTPRQTAKDIMHEFGHGERGHQIESATVNPARRGKDITGERTTEIPLEQLPEDVFDAVIDAGEYGATPRHLANIPETVSVNRAGLEEHTEPNMLARAQAGGGEEQSFLDAMDSIMNDPKNVELSYTFQDAMHKIVRDAWDEKIRAQGFEPAKSLEDTAAEMHREIENAAPRETGAPSKAKLTKAEEIEKNTLEQYAWEQKLLMKEYGEKFANAKTEAEKSGYSREFGRAKAEVDRVQGRLTQLGGQAETRAARAKVPEAIDVEAKVVSEPVTEAKQITKSEPTPLKAEEVTETPTSEKVVSAPANNLRRLLEGMNLTRFNVNTLTKELKAKGLDVPEELTAQLPELVKELKDRGWVNEKIGGTYTLLTAPPKLLKGVSGGKIADVTNLRGSLEESLKALGAEEPVKAPEAAPTPTSTIRPGQFHFDETGRRWEVRRVEGDQVTITSGRGGGERTQVLSKDDILARRGIMPGGETGLPIREPIELPSREDLSGEGIRARYEALRDLKLTPEDIAKLDAKGENLDQLGLDLSKAGNHEAAYSIIDYTAEKNLGPEAKKAIEAKLGSKETRLPEREPTSEEIDIDLSSLEEGGGKVEPPNLADKMKEKLTPDELQAIAKLFGTEKKRKGTSETPQEVLDAQKAALRGLVEKEKKGGEGLPPTEEIPEGGGPKQNFDVTLSDGTTHKVRASSAEEAKTKAEEVLAQYNSSKTVDKVEPTLSTLEKAAKYEIEPVREAGESISEQVTEGKAEQKAQGKRIGEQLKYQETLRKAQVSETKKLQKVEDKELTQLAKKEAAIRRAQTKEKFAEKPYTVGLSNGRVVTIRARNEKVAREVVESAIRRNKSTVTVQGVTAKPSALDEAITGAARKVEETGFLQNPVVKVLNAVKSITFGGDVGHLLRQGKQMNADLLFSKHAKKVWDQFPVLWKLAKGGMKELEGLNERIYSDPDIKMMVDNFGMDMPGMGKGLKEEAFHGAGLAENLPVIGKHYVERSEAVYTGGLNFLRAAEAKKWIEKLKKDGFTPDNAPEKYNAVSRAVNIISQRGSFGPAYQKLFSDASAIYGAPRAKAARLQNALELFRGGTSGRVVRTTAAKTLAFNAGLYGLLAATTGAKFIDDPEASDFGKIRINDKITVDPWVGLGVTARTVAKLTTGKGKSPYTGKEYPVTPSDALMAEFLGGIAPGVKLAWEAMSGKDLRGYQIDRLDSLLNVAPLTGKSIQELLKEGDLDEAIELSILQFMGEGVDVFNYEESKAKQARLRAERGLSTGRSGRKKKRTYAFD